MKEFKEISPYLGAEAVARFKRKIEKTDTCWVWTAFTMPNGYGHVRINGTSFYAHRVSYVIANGEIPKGMDLDHLCRNRACVNPNHLEPVTRRVNLLRGRGIPAIFAARLRCAHGHLLKGNNVRHYQGYRVCRECHKLSERERRRKLREAV